MLALILTPALGGLVLARGVPAPEPPQRLLPALGLSIAVMVPILAVALVAALSTGSARWLGRADWLLTVLRDRAGSPWPAAAAHAAGNVVLGGLVGSGLLTLDPAGPWATFPAPTGLVFAASAGLAALALARQRGASTARSSSREATNPSENHRA